MTSELKPCPFCGEPAKDNDGGNSVYGRMWWRVGCGECGVTFADREKWDHEANRLVYPEKDCFAFWNRRPIEDALRAEVEALREEARKAQRMCCELADEKARLRTEVEQLRLGVMTASERAGKYHAEVEALKKELDLVRKIAVKYIEEDNAGYLAATAEAEQLKAALTDEGHTPTNMQMWVARALKAEDMVARLQAEPMVPLRLVEDIQKEANHILRVLDGGHFLNAGEINGLMASIRAAREGAK